MIILEGFVNNNLDINDNIYCQSNYIDDCDICDGLGSQLYYDSDGDGLGVGNENLLCPEEVTNEYVFNNDDIDDNFFCIEIMLMNTIYVMDLIMMLDVGALIWS